MSRTISKDAIVGSWRLLSAVQHFDDGTKVAEFGPHACGYLSYTAEGTVSAVTRPPTSTRVRPAPSWPMPARIRSTSRPAR